MTRRELNKTDFELIEKAFELVVAHFQKMTDKRDSRWLLMTRRELNKTDFELIEKAFELVVAHFQKMTDKTILLRVEELRQEFKDAHTGWLWFEDGGKSPEQEVK